MNRLCKILLLVLSVSLCLNACGDDNESKEEMYEIMTLKVAAYRDYFVAPGHGIVTDMLGFVVTDEYDRTYIIETIKGFEDEYQEGYEYTVKVKAVPKRQGELLEDGVGYSYYLLEIIKKERVAVSR